MVRELCGKCLHSKEAHTPDNCHFMYCNSCMSLCDLEDFNYYYKPTTLEEIIRIQLAREYEPYNPKELKKK